MNHQYSLTFALDCNNLFFQLIQNFASSPNLIQNKRYFQEKILNKHNELIYIYHNCILIPYALEFDLLWLKNAFIFFCGITLIQSCGKNKIKLFKKSHHMTVMSPSTSINDELCSCVVRTLKSKRTYKTILLYAHFININ